VSDLPASARLALAASMELQDGEVCFVGIGNPSDAALLAKHSHAPDMTLIYESGVIGSDPKEPPLSTGSPSVADGAMMITDGLGVFAELQAGRIDVGLDPQVSRAVDLFDKASELLATRDYHYNRRRLTNLPAGNAAEQVR